MKKISFVFGTRPEAIKMAPIIHACYQYRDQLNVKICLSGQHKEMLSQVMDFFQLTAEYDLNLMRQDQTFFDITRRWVKTYRKSADDFKPDLVIVQGDTTTTLLLR
jgi:UDP-N-acetylglucosamine 2-epimerase (non-hydrolysing)